MHLHAYHHIKLVILPLLTKFLGVSKIIYNFAIINIVDYEK